MLDRLFAKILEMSAAGSIVILAVLLARLLLKKSPKIYSYLLWLVVLFRLLCPLAMEISWGGVPPVELSAYPTESESLSLGGAAAAALSAVADAANDGPGIQTFRYQNGEIGDCSWWEVWGIIGISILEYIWLAGVLVLLWYSFRSLRKLRDQLVGAVLLKDNVWLADHIETPFVMGVFRPKIYLPSNLAAEKRRFILRHELYHIKRKDHIVKLLAFAALCVHWFNPLVWVAFFLMSRDMEMSCDEGVLKHWGSEVRTEYSGLLLELATGRNLFAGAPLAFGEGDTGSRIRNILKYRELKRWQAAFLLILVAGFGFFLSVDKLTKMESLLGNRYWVEEILYEAGIYSFSYTEETAPFYTITSDYTLKEMPRGSGESKSMPLRRMNYSRQELYGFFFELKNNVHERLDRVTEVWRAEREHGGYYLVMQTRRDEVLLAVSTHEKVRWLFDLEAIATTPGDWDYMKQSIRNKLGGADVELLAIAGMGTNDADEEYMVAGFYSDGTAEKSDVGYAIIHRVGWSYQMINCFILQGAGQNENQIWYMEPAVLNETGELRPEDTYDVVLCNDPDLHTVTQEVKSGDEVVYTEEYPIHGQPAILLLNWEERDRTYAGGGAGSVALYFHNKAGNQIDPP